VLLLKAAALPVGIDVIGNRGAFEANRSGENIQHRAVQPAGARFAQAGGQGARMDASFKQRFIRIDVAHAAQESLIEQQGLDGGAPGLEQRAKIVE